MSDELMVSEIFGPTIQGEGPYAGHTAIFLRLGRCNLDCRWCDTPYTWDWQGKNGVSYDPKVELTRMSVDQVRRKLVGLKNKRVFRNKRKMWRPRLVVSGGEPLLQAKALTALLESLEPEFGDRWDDWSGYDIETNGTRPPLETELKITYVISPKLSNSGVEWKDKWITNLQQFTVLSHRGEAFYKFVIDSEASAKEARIIEGRTRWNTEATYFMPEGRTPEELDANSAICYESTYTTDTKYSDRLHIRLWGDKRGV